MIQLTDNMVYWVEDFINVRKLSYGFFNPDELSEGDEKMFIFKQIEYLCDKLNVSAFRKVHVYEKTFYGDNNQIMQDTHKGNIILEHEYQQDNIKPYVERYKSARSHIWIKEIVGNDLSEIAIINGFLVLVPTEYSVVKLAQIIVKICEKYKYESVNTSELQPMFDEIVKLYSGSSIVTDLGIDMDARSYKNKPKEVGIVHSQNIYGELAKI
ncbi:MAG: hypothetical protein K2G44_03555 [Clostridia bacterium]|nr:hypothetical protein [Clostridia bacterium]